MQMGEVAGSAPKPFSVAAHEEQEKREEGRAGAQKITFLRKLPPLHIAAIEEEEKAEKG
jgi:hypothetical protein